ncbi:MAG: hypothetical protein A3C90_01965 [Candidatus Magasanikbacteria bacterium RIFCSPHIGHO2_02_FULL_51_14]|uniref:Bacterial sugar transferase domain-containing protein n=1 Tax=Candidatus Magasanikbacteria bacterium RIFCSPHIGHO2_02_FULL_51_14 TaxID=1798683 RepID=A0A1F6MP99_9BACT|nr:MAG: hypothetical protein A3C90_01965 [Candidatus Magasanikbacteria bacterium RIFCSPHIGHO2_02_FULL_51_14]
MKKFEIFLVLLKAPIDFFALLFAGVSAYYLRFTDWAIGLRPVMFEMSLVEFLNVILWVIVAWLMIFAFAGLYSMDPNRKMSRDLSRVFFACSTGVAAIALYIMFTQQLFDSRFLVAAGWAFAVLYVSAGRLLLRGVKGLLYRAGVGLLRVAVIGSGAVADAVVETLKRRKELGYRVVGIVEAFDDAARKKLLGFRLDELLLVSPKAREDEALEVLDFANEHHIVFKYSADLFATYSANMAVSPLAGVPIVEIKRTRLDGWGRVVKRLFDNAAAIIMIIVTSPVTLISAIIILLETGRPVIYKNERVGLYGRKFFTFKFRSMHQKDCTGLQFGESGKKAEERERQLIRERGIKEGPIYKIKDDPRVTLFGRFLRRWSIDELPQFFNVLGGSMSIVGPRPHQPREVEKYEKHHKKVFSIKPGVTGLAQISGRSDLSFDDEARLDVLYMEKWSLFMDMIIFLKTPFVLFKKRKAL